MNATQTIYPDISYPRIHILVESFRFWPTVSDSILCSPPFRTKVTRKDQRPVVTDSGFNPIVLFGDFSEKDGKTRFRAHGKFRNIHLIFSELKEFISFLQFWSVLWDGKNWNLPHSAISSHTVESSFVVSNRIEKERWDIDVFTSKAILFEYHTATRSLISDDSSSEEEGWGWVGSFEIIWISPSEGTDSPNNKIDDVYCKYSQPLKKILFFQNLSRSFDWGEMIWIDSPPSI